jgi:osmotically-inducible protein OsmY
VSPTTTRRDVRRRIVQALHRNADLDARQIRVAVSDDIVTQSGTVRSWSERDAADRAAGSAPGIRHVDNQIIVEPPQPSDLDVVDPLC